MLIGLSVRLGKRVGGSGCLSVVSGKSGSGAEGCKPSMSGCCGEAGVLSEGTTGAEPGKGCREMMSSESCALLLSIAGV